jgi:hypothetical protein
MKAVRNKTNEPIKIPLEGGKVLHLGPRKTGQISDGALERAAVRKLIEVGTLEVADAEGGFGPGDTSGTSVHESTHGHPQPTQVMPKGNR